MTKTKSFRFDTITRTNIKMAANYLKTSETRAIEVCLAQFISKNFTVEEFNKAYIEMLTSECHHDKF